MRSLTIDEASWVSGGDDCSDGTCSDGTGIGGTSGNVSDGGCFGFDSQGICDMGTVSITGAVNAGNPTNFGDVSAISGFLGAAAGILAVAATGTAVPALAAVGLTLAAISATAAIAAGHPAPAPAKRGFSRIQP